MVRSRVVALRTRIARRSNVPVTLTFCGVEISLGSPGTTGLSHLHDATSLRITGSLVLRDLVVLIATTLLRTKKGGRKIFPLAYSRDGF